MEQTDTSGNPATFIIRPARLEEAAAICAVLRRSITELCVADHQNNPDWLDEWLANKQPEIVAGWIADPENCLLVAVAGERVLAAGCIKRSGAIMLNYVSPDARFRGVSRAMLRALEAVARRNGCREVTLTSTLTAHDFYLAAGYTDRDDALARGDSPLMGKVLEPDDTNRPAAGAAPARTSAANAAPKPPAQSDRRQRLGQALRENLKRRKQQIRGRASQGASQEARDAAAEAAGVAVPERD
ncbi:GNAT family N-acetyltransferase [Afipia sp. P52-10]|uniref:GNAT family N-acetyltransferase n=1 Tax=Afipia sp. P52-10 TaxID=1429916 RepID=UPI001362D42D|nr:GNAT family N-acetyltransferase [Afipia sp. P52-10]